MKTLNEYRLLDAESKIAYIESWHNPIDAPIAYGRVTEFLNSTKIILHVSNNIIVSILNKININHYIGIDLKMYLSPISECCYIAHYNNALFGITEEQHTIINAALNLITEGYTDEADMFLSTVEANNELTEDEISFLSNIGIGLPTDLPDVVDYHINDITSRFSGAMWFEEVQNKVITLAGVGGIGSWTALLLSRMNPKAIYLYDNDEVEEANMSGQLYNIRDVGKNKVDALADTMRLYSMYNNVFALSTRFTEDSEASDIMICGFDSIEARKLFFNKWKAHVALKTEEDKKKCLFIDGRLSAECLQVYTVTGDNPYGMEEYTKTLFDSSEADAVVCSYKQTSYMANMIGGIIVNLFTNFVANEIYGFEGRELPFFVEYSGMDMQLKMK